MVERSKLVKMKIANLGCVGQEGLEVMLDNIICIVGANNSGKSTILRAYELAVAGKDTFYVANDLCKSVPDGPACVEIWVHIPKNTQNIAEEWKSEENDLLLVRSKWEWSKENDWKRKRFTWDPRINDYSDENNASGLDTVFNSRLPQPFRIGSLDNPDKEHETLLTLILEPIAEKLKKEIDAEGSDLKNAISSLTTLANQPIIAERHNLDKQKMDLNKSHNRIFPDLSIDFEIGIGDIRIDPLKLLKENSHLKFTEWGQDLHWSQQGTGSQRALFWTMLQVRSKLQTIFNTRQQNEKKQKELEKSIAKLRKDAESVKGEKTKQTKLAQIAQIEQQLKQLNGAIPSASADDVAGQDVVLPGYMLIIDEPENGLHPNAIRAACEYLYGLADDSTWQVMLATHSPVFINPLYDHTTIVRLDRSQQNPSPSAYKSDSVHFSSDDAQNLKMLNRFDSGLAEMFFGQYPILVEGDTEYAAFESIIAQHPEQFPLNKKPVFVRARGKYTLLLIIRMLREFKVPFAILHDVDKPTSANGNKNPAWTANESIYSEILDTRKHGIHVVHRVSMCNFENAHLNGNEADNKDKPWRILKAIRNDTSVEESIRKVLRDLMDPNASEEPFDQSFDRALPIEWDKWNKLQMQAT